MTTKTTNRLPEQFRRIRLELARERAHPEGEHNSGYILVAPLDSGGRIDAACVKAHKESCRVVRFEHARTEDIGHLVRIGGGWKFHYDIEGADEDEAGYRLGEERFVPGEYVSIKSKGVMHTYKVISVAPL